MSPVVLPTNPALINPRTDQPADLSTCGLVNLTPPVIESPFDNRWLQQIVMRLFSQVVRHRHHFAVSASPGLHHRRASRIERQVSCFFNHERNSLVEGTLVSEALSP